ncbi:MAG: helix-turn-helix transcriptional regulator [Saprospiraceae bacterium]|jgi:putative transcriptional regulator|uniref:helix-turn-helix transcriptional regulator n=1 Tax=Candidatus Brachybacter algidus TaxID=2982024 RepID=UPI001B661FCB|nr:helix-turn-helix transcriptional regulator [Candidatus Brachybacter algidus]MBP7304964.1 helix-turn-helix transcriptional regulator [Saprospiraceae bacterium]MBK6374450.1 helix-turn-helix transcriptional regulator [Candidatus Brachybacter algidus]MBK6449785.1 helix-turn-helix transcriptional regulator [Candidatus Brachybacter algidus]MBK7604328.1 helix-turn-helix transcriptional regulator [Candidatus Brachybacter algidus]MBK8355504.1 helix-turn-helix transcriptional regulator [Candidatus Br
MKNSIKVERAKKNLTQADLAKMINVSRQTINAMELGKYVPSTLLALKLARIFGVEVSAIFELEETDE